MDSKQFEETIGLNTQKTQLELDELLDFLIENELFHMYRCIPFPTLLQLRDSWDKMQSKLKRESDS